MGVLEKLESSIFGMEVELSHITQHASNLDVSKKMQLIDLASQLIALARPNINSNVSAS